MGSTVVAANHTQVTTPTSPRFRHRVSHDATLGAYAEGGAARPVSRSSRSMISVIAASWASR